MPVRSTTSEYQPSPPWLRLKTTKAGTGVNRVARATATNNVKSNMCVAPANSGGGGGMKVNVSFSG
jgi:hypothetical protein